MKKIFFLFTLCLTFSIFAVAQQNKVEALKIAYLTKRLNLTTEDAQKFWPVYNKYISEIRQARKENRDTDEINLEEKVFLIRKKYKEEFSKVLSEQRANEFFKAEKEFYNSVRKEFNERQRGRRQ